MPLSQAMILFLGLLVGGEAILIPAIYLVLSGYITFIPFISIVLCATLLSDTFWYIIGRYVPIEKIYQVPFLSTHKSAVKRAERLLRTYHAPGIIFSKFVYGTRTLVQVLAGMLRIRYVTYILMDLVGVILWTGTLLIAGWILYEVFAVTNLNEPLRAITIILTLAVISVLLIWLLTKKLTNNSSQ